MGGWVDAWAWRSLPPVWCSRRERRRAGVNLTCLVVCRGFFLFFRFFFLSEGGKEEEEEKQT